MAEFAYRQVGRTGLRVTELGLGCATLGGSRIDVARRTAEDIVAAAWDAGVRYVDTAPFYGVGQAERCVGDALRDRPRDEWVLSTKVGRLLRPNPTGVHADGRRHPLPFDPVYDYSYDGIMRSFEDSLQRLGLGRIDILYVHDIGTYQHGPEAHPGLMRTLRESGYRALEKPPRRRRGAGDRDRRERARGIARSDGVGAVGRLSAGRPLHAAGAGAARRSLAEVPCRRHLDRGRRAAQLRYPGRAATPGTTTPAPPEVVERVKAIAAVCDAHRVPLPAAALQFPLAHPAVAAIIPGPRNADEFRANLGLLRHPIPAALWADLKQAGLLHPAAPVPASG